MEKHWPALCALILTLAALVHFDTAAASQADAASRVTRTKPGYCPRVLKVVPLHKGCVCDDDCPGNHKCCSVERRDVCVPPAFKKPGLCPRARWGSGVCAEHCYDDSDCPGKEKCCSSGCGHQCTAPYTVKPGRCGLPQRAPMCAEYCYHDGDCAGKQKCCKTSCGHNCSDPC
ncbi:WAP four-disulfide core domain protein 3 [Nelusetta ayraudi]|uniref:WAP four-disulfide core domain protein 3 n=1 Tax=Nelusetta ayraudi TaxID=303726 RepID=UPI003F703301